jgi:hypothetical protein
MLVAAQLCSRVEQTERARFARSRLLTATLGRPIRPTSCRNSPCAEARDRRRDSLMGRDPSAWEDIRPGLVTLGAIAGWIVLWCICSAIGLNVGKRMVGPKGIEGYLAMSGIVGGCFITPLAFVSGIFLLLAKRHVVLFILTAVLVGFAITVWPVIAWVVPVTTEEGKR